MQLYCIFCILIAKSLAFPFTIAEIPALKICTHV